MSLQLTKTEDGKRAILHTNTTADAAKAIALAWGHGEMPAGQTFKGDVFDHTWEMAEEILGEEADEFETALGAKILDGMLHEHQDLSHVFVLDSAREELRGLIG